MVGASNRPSITGVSTPDAALPGRWWELRKAVAAKMTDAGPDVVASHFALYAFPVLDLLGDRPLVVHFHGPWAEESAVEGSPAATVRLKALIERTVYRRAARCIVLSSAFRDVLHRTYGVPLYRIRIVPGGVDVDRFATGLTRAEARRHLGWAVDRPTVLSVRRLAPRMGLEALVEAAALVVQEHPELQVRIAGKGPLRAKLQQQIAAAGLNAHVRLVGFVPDEDLPVAYRAADVSIVPTQALEGFGLITLESLAAGTPVLVTPVGGLPETVRDLDPALMLRDTSVEAIADGLRAVLTGRFAQLSGEPCQAYVRERFAWPVIAEQVAAVYREVTG